MFPHVALLLCMAIGLTLFVGAGRSWLSAPHWSLIGAALTGVSFVMFLPYYATTHNRVRVVFVSFGFAMLTIDAIRKYNKLRQATA